jgi:hypothetical protein
LWHRRTSLRIVAKGNKLGSINVLVERAVGVDLDGNVGWEVELRVQCASTMSSKNGGCGAELPDVGGARGRAIQTLLDAVAFTLDQRKSEINLSDNPSHVEASNIAYADLVSDLKSGADRVEAVTNIASDWTGKRSGGKKESSRDDERVEHVRV